MTSTQEELEELRETVGRFLERRADEASVRRLMEDEAGYDPAVWSQMGEQLGLQGLAIPEELGGSGFDYEALRVVFEEMGKVLLPSPFFATVGLAANALLLSDDDEARKQYLPGIASGETVATLAFSEERGGWTADAVSCQAAPGDEGWALTGAKRFVPDAHVADLVLVAARTPGGLSLFAVEKDAPGLRTEVELSLDLTRKLARVHLDATPARLIGREGGAADLLHQTLLRAGVALAAESVGGMQHMLDATLRYSKERIQFGRPIGSFQVIKHKLADMLVAVESAKSAAYDAARAIATRRDDEALSASVAKAFCTDAYFKVSADSVQIHGGIGFTWEHPAHLYFKRAKSSQLLLGSPSYHRDLVGQAIGV
ncbi:acyl-CoA dehydrogenase family protein [Nocardioides marmotae]|uniref:acyl-CoA dehydrogenase family protein n=1 Tax=Nocardioides marmotae TaxID=2663857 RepID=UPI0012B5C2D7|nr:acyl-CoA dehydrogenase family protein [Nocardioides marmotae]MBC9732336.1 acyl-CoA/acyl-ACP dehydrogenase [Nocardioides marmotae]MTB83456.1 acyl-CoA dehydrogenase [Nocardioides marmotae]